MSYADDMEDATIVAGSYEAQRLLASKEADELEVHARKGRQAELTLLYVHAARAFGFAVEIAKMTRADNAGSADHFVANQTRLMEHARRLEQIPEKTRLLLEWPPTPGVTFCWKAGNSFVEVAIVFAKMINTAVLAARGEVALNGNTSYDSLAVSPIPHARFAEWQAKTIKELLTRELPRPDVWPSMADIHTEYGSFIRKLEAEFETALGAASESIPSAVRSSNAIREIKPKRKKLSSKESGAVLTKCRRRCCLCFGLHADFSTKRGHIAHLDRDRSNNDCDNLVFLCLEHHDQYDSPPALSRGLNPDEVQLYRNNLHSYIDTHSAASQPLGGLGRADGPRILQLPGSQYTIRNAGIGLNEGVIVLGDYAVNKKVIHKNEVRSGPEHIDEKQALRIRLIVEELGEIDEDSSGRPTYSEWHRRLWKRFGVTSYKLIPRERGQEAEDWLVRQKAIQRRKLRRTDNTRWRNSLYTAIWARAKEIGMDRQAVYDLAFERLALKNPLSSLKTLGERNLKKLHNIIFSLPRPK